MQARFFLIAALVELVMLKNAAAGSGSFGTEVNPPSGASNGTPGIWNNGPLNWGQAAPFMNAAYSFAEFNGVVYAGGRVVSTAPRPTARILKSSDGGVTWFAVSVRFKTSDHEVRKLWAGSDGYLYAVTQSGTPRIYRTPDGVHWALMATLDAADGYGRWFVEFNGYLYLSAVNDAGATNGARIYRSADGATWEVASYFAPPITRVDSLLVRNGHIYALTDQCGPGGAGFIFGSEDGLNFTKLNTNQMIGSKSGAHSLVFYQGAYYVGQQDTTSAGRIWKSTDLASWSIVFEAPGGRQEPEVYRIYSTGSLLWAGTRTVSGTGGRVYSSPDGVIWTQSGSDGFGDINYVGVHDFIFIPEFSRLLTSQHDLHVNVNYPTRPQFLDFF